MPRSAIVDRNIRIPPHPDDERMIWHAMYGVPFVPLLIENTWRNGCSIDIWDSAVLVQVSLLSQRWWWWEWWLLFHCHWRVSLQYYQSNAHSIQPRPKIRNGGLQRIPINPGCWWWQDVVLVDTAPWWTGLGSRINLVRVWSSHHQPHQRSQQISRK